MLKERLKIYILKKNICFVIDFGIHDIPKCFCVIAYFIVLYSIYRHRTQMVFSQNSNFEKKKQINKINMKILFSPFTMT